MDYLCFLRKRRVERGSEARDMDGSMNTVDKEQSFLENFFLNVVIFDYDKAKNLAEKERDPIKSPQSPAWQHILNCLIQLCMAEKSYTSLTFLMSKGFRRKDGSLKLTYEVLRNEFHKVEEGENKAPNDSLERLLAHLCGQLCQFISARLDLMDFYEKACNVGCGKNMPFEELLGQVQQISSSNQKNFHHPSLGHLKSVFTIESESLSKLLEAQLAMQHWDFLTSLLHLHEAHSKLSSWEALIQLKDNRRGLSFTSRLLPIPLLYQWLWKLKGSLVSKFSLYFHEILSKQTSTQDMKNLSSKATVDFYARMVTFQRKMDAKCVALVFDANKCEQYRGHGYHHPDKHWEPPQGLETYPAIVCCPAEKPSILWPNVVMIMADRAHELNIMDRIFCFYDKASQVTYFLTRIEPRMTLVVIFDTKKSEKDSYITGFMITFANELRCNKIFINLKPGSK